MDQIKIGKFISKKRKEKNITQSKLSEMLNVTDRAISKWENGICMPDSGTIPQLCEILNITINDLFSGEVIDMKDNEKKLEQNLLEMTKLKQEKDKQLLNLEIFIGFLVVILMSIFIFIASSIEMENIYRILLIIVGLVIFIIGMYWCLKIEQTAGYYECKVCGYRYVPKAFRVFLAMHINRTRYMKCPKCGENSWNKKVISK